MPRLSCYQSKENENEVVHPTLEGIEHTIRRINSASAPRRSLTYLTIKLKRGYLYSKY